MPTRVLWIVNLSKARQLGLFDRSPPMATPSHVVHVKPHTRMTAHGIEQVTAHDRTVATAQPTAQPTVQDRVLQIAERKDRSYRDAGGPTITDAEGTEWRRDRPNSANELVEVRLATLMQRWHLDDPTNAVGIDGTGGIGTRMEDFRSFAAQAHERGIALRAPEVRATSNGIGIDDGRHRIAEMARQGRSTIVVAVRPEERADFLQRLDVDTDAPVSDGGVTGAGEAPEGGSMPRSKLFTVGRFEGDREAKTADVLDANGKRIGYIHIENAEKFVSAASRVRTVAFDAIRVERFDGPEDDREREYSAADGYTKASGLKAAKAQIQTWLTPDPEPEPEAEQGVTMDELRVQETARLSADLVSGMHRSLERMVKRWGDDPSSSIPNDKLHAHARQAWRELRAVSYRSPQGWVVNQAAAERLAAAEATATMDELFTKLTGKVGELHGVKAWGSGHEQFTIRGTMADGRTVQISQRMIVNTSSLGKVFNQFPARIYVDGQQVSERQYQRALDAARPADQQAEIDRIQDVEAKAARAKATATLAANLAASDVRLQSHAPRYQGLTDGEVETAAQAFGLLHSSVVRPSVRSTKRSTVFRAPADARNEMRLMDRAPKPGTEGFYRLMSDGDLATAQAAMDRIPPSDTWADNARAALASVRSERSETG